MTRQIRRITRWLASLFGILAITSPLQVNAQQGKDPFPVSPSPTVAVMVSSPHSGQAVQGSVIISGTTEIEGFKEAELTFGYAGDPTRTWFLINHIAEPTSDGKLGEWDTSTLTDGNYALRLVVTLQSGQALTVTVSGVRVRNYSPIETETPTPRATRAPGQVILPTSTGTPVPSPTRIFPTPTPLPRNPAQLTQGDLLFNFVRGVIIAIGLFALLGLYILLKKFFFPE